ncbi:hypothetical protein RB597_007414 [Gaeumannomyces tritici]
MTGEQEEGVTAAAAAGGDHHVGSPDPGDMLPDGHQIHRPRQDGRRILLAIYVHGYMGKDSSFRSFPAHVHDLLKFSLSSHAIHTKIYPRYKTYRYIDVAAENFSRWLEPHESPDTDVVLIGHSMGGLLAADVVLLKPREGVTPAHPGSPFRHRILGIIALDSPFLGLHPGIIAAGIASLFRSKAQPPKEEDGGSLSPTSTHSPRFPPLSPGMDPAGRLSTDVYSDLAAAAARGSLDLSRGSLDISPLGSPDGSSAALSYFPSTSSLGQQQNGGPPDPHYNPPFWNDVMFKDRGWMRNMWHFAKKRKIEGSSLIEAATNHLVCHMQYGKSLTDFRGLHERYESVRRLEDVDEIGGQQAPLGQGGGGRDKARVRFVNYFTISTGRDKTPDRGRSPSRLDTSGAGVPGYTVGVGGVATRSPSASIGPSSPLREVSPRPMPESHPASPSLLRQPSGLHLHPDDGRGDGTDTPRISIEDHSNLGRPKFVEAVGPISEQEQEKEKGSAPEPAAAAASFTTDAKDPEPETETKGDAASAEGDDGGISTATEGLNKLELGLETGLDLIPERPEEPQPPVLAADASAEERKRADKEHMRARKAYLEAIKAREKAIKERQKAIEKRRAKMEKEEAKKEKEEKKRQQTEEKRREKEEQRQEKERLKREKDEANRLADEGKRMEEEAKRLAQGTQGQQQSEGDQTDVVEGSERGSGSGSSDSVDRQADLAKHDTALRQAAEGVVTGSSAAAAPSGQAEEQQQQQEQQAEDAKPPPAEEGGGAPKKSKKPRKFCMLPKKPAGGGRDSQWVEVFMEGVDEIGAHTGLFLPGPHYERLVGDVGMRIVGWAQDDATKRAILDAS